MVIREENVAFIVVVFFIVIISIIILFSCRSSLAPYIIIPRQKYSKITCMAINGFYQIVKGKGVTSLKGHRRGAHLPVSGR